MMIGDDSSKQTSVDERLETIGQHEDGAVNCASVNVDGGDAGDHKHAASHADLTSNQEGLQILTGKGQLTVGIGDAVVLELLVGQLHDGNKAAICMPSIIPTKHMRTKKTMTETAFGTPANIVVFPSNSADNVTAKAKPRMASDMTTRAQKRIFCNEFHGGSFDSTIALPAISDANETFVVNSIK